MDMKVYLCIVNNSVIFRKLFLTALDLCLKATSSKSGHLFPIKNIFFYYFDSVFFMGMGMMTPMIKAHVNMEESLSIMI